MAFPARRDPSLIAPAPRQEAPATADLRIRPRSRRSGNLLLNLSIGKRLTLGFLLAALIAAVAAGLIGVLRSQSLGRQSDFYQQLLQTNTSLNTGASYVQLMNTELHNLLSAATAAAPSQETIAQDRQAILGLATRYDGILSTYLAQALVSKHPDEAALLAEADQAGLMGQQQTLAASALRTWLLYRSAQEQILQDISSGNLSDAQNQIRFQAEPTNADALSALRALIQLDGRLATAVRQAAAVEERNELITSIIGAILASLAIVLVGWFISGTLVRRLRHLQQVTRAIERGQLEARVTVIGRDEIAEVSAAFNAMLEALLNLLQETRRQRDALTNAAEHLFSDMRVVSAGDLRVNAPVSDDPIGMLANAFNFTVGRFRRFVLRVQSTIQQLEVMTRRQLEQAEALLLVLQVQQSSPQPEGASTRTSTLRGRHNSGALKGEQEALERDLAELIVRLRRSRERLQRLSGEEFAQHLNTLSSALQEAETLSQRSGVWTGSGGTSLRRGGPLPPALLERLQAAASALQQGLTRSLGEFDRDLSSLAQEMNRLRAKLNTSSTPATASAPGGPETSDLARQAATFAAEMISLAQQLARLTQEMRTSLVGFQLDTVEIGGAESPALQPGAQPAPYTLAPGPASRSLKTW